MSREARVTLSEVLRESTRQQRAAWAKWANYYGYTDFRAYVADRYYLEEAPFGGEIET